MKNVAGVAADSGKLLWKSSFPGSTAVVPTPIYHDSHVYVSSGYGAGCKLVQLDDNNQATEVYSNSLMKNHHGGVLRVDNSLYGYSDGAGWVCQNFKTGEKVWNDRNFGKGSLTYADGMLYCLSERDGTIALFEVSTTGWQEKGRSWKTSTEHQAGNPSNGRPLLAGDRTCRGLRQRSSPRKWARPRPLPPRELLASTLAGCQNRRAIGIPHLSCAINCPEIVHEVSARTEITRLSTLNKLEISRRRTDLCSLFRQWV